MYAGFTYRYSKVDPLYPFGFGLSYTTFAYSDLEITPKVELGQPIRVAVTVTNTGRVAGDEVVQLYVSDDEASYPVPIRHLEGFRRVHLAPEQSERIVFTLEPKQLYVYDDEGNGFVEPGTFTVSVGGGQPIPDGGAPYLVGRFEIIAPRPKE